MTLAVQAYQDHLANQVPQDQRDLKEKLARKVVPALLVSLALLARQESVGCLACPVHLALLVGKESVERV